VNAALIFLIMRVVDVRTLVLKSTVMLISLRQSRFAKIRR